ncbi:hypothetical protein Aduo_006695 [Ancylostoma duodenale]
MFYRAPYEIHSIIPGTRQSPFFGQDIPPGAKLPPPAAAMVGTPPSPPLNPPPPAPPKAAAVPAGKVQHPPLTPPLPLAARSQFHFNPNHFCVTLRSWR